MKLLILAAVLLFSTSAYAAKCQSTEQTEKIMKEIPTQHGKFQSLNDAQWNFLRGVSAASQGTPAGLPPGDHAGIITDDSHPGGLVMFFDADKICQMMPMSAEAVEDMSKVGAGVIDHAGQEN